MSSKGRGFLLRVFMLALVAFLALPMAAFAQDRGRGRGKPTDVFVNGHDARDGRWDKDKGRKHRDRDRNRDEDDWRRRGQSNDDWRRRNDDRNRQNGNWDPYGNNGGYGNYGGYGNNGGYGNYGGYGSSQARQTALNAGYNKGIQEGRKDRSRGERFDYTDEGSYQSATADYSSRTGDRESYRQYFRQGFANGYRDGYRGY